VNRQQAAAMREIFGKEIDVSYFSEHTHIDSHHGTMALDRIIAPTLGKYGAFAAADIIRGFEEFKLLQEIADQDLFAQISWIDEEKNYRRAADLIWSRIQSGDLKLPRETFHEEREERSTTHTHDEHRLVVIENGEMDFWSGLGDPVRLRAGDAHFVPRHRLHGSVITSQQCLYHQPIVGEDLMQAIMAEIRC
jgi:quercetin dioxygenase-like cupin family protein